MTITLNGTTGITFPNGGTQATGISTPVTVANGGTGLSSVGTSGNVLTSNGTTWVSQAPAGGGVTSLNGQTGAITSTDYGAIGSYVIGWDNSLEAQNSTTYADIGSTVAGSNIYKVANSSAGENLNLSAPTTSGITSAGLSGTWRRMNAFRCGAYSSPGVRPAFLFVRIS